MKIWLRKRSTRKTELALKLGAIKATEVACRNMIDEYTSLLERWYNGQIAEGSDDYTRLQELRDRIAEAEESMNKRVRELRYLK